MLRKNFELQFKLKWKIGKEEVGSEGVAAAAGGPTHML